MCRQNTASRCCCEIPVVTRNSPPKLGGGPAAKRKPDRAQPQEVASPSRRGGSPAVTGSLREPPRPRLRSGPPPNLGGESPHSNSYTAVFIDRLFQVHSLQMTSAIRVGIVADYDP